MLFRLSPYRRDGGGFSASFFSFGLEPLRPDTYTDEAQGQLRWLWLAWALIIPCVALVIFLLP
jgi:hypothetical protein